VSNLFNRGLVIEKPVTAASAKDKSRNVGVIRGGGMVLSVLSGNEMDGGHKLLFV
jgi:hypothetical protein